MQQAFRMLQGIESNVENTLLIAVIMMLTYLDVVF